MKSRRDREGRRRVRAFDQALGRAMAWSMVGLTLLSLGFVALTTGLVFLAWWLVEGPIEYTLYSAVVAVAGALGIWCGWRLLRRSGGEGT